MKKTIYALVVIALWTTVLAVPNFSEIHGASFIFLLVLAGLWTFGLGLFFPSQKVPPDNDTFK